MKNTITKKEQIRNKIDRLLQNEAFITWDMLETSQYLHSYGYLSHTSLSDEAKIVIDYMKELGIDYVRYSDKYSDKRMHGNNRGFYNDIAERRKRKLQALMSLNQN